MEQRVIVTTTEHRKDNDLPVCEVKIDFPETTEEAVTMWGEDVVLSHVRQSAVIALQGAVRNRLEKKDEEGLPVATDKPVADIAADFEGGKWKPTKRAEPKTRVEKAATLAEDMDDTEIDEMMKRLREQKKERAAAAA